MKILLAYFSATGNTAAVAREIKTQLSEMGGQVDEWDITTPAGRSQDRDLSPYEAFVFGFPTYAMRPPRLAREWLATLEGGGRKCATFFSFGGFGVEPCHYTTKKILDQRGFRLAASAQFLGAHTFNLGGWRAMAGRPDESDFQTAREFASRSFQRFSGQDQDLIGPLREPEVSEAELDALETRRFVVVSQLPTRAGRECSLCGICEEMCPSGAMDAERGEADREKCLTCFRCLANCPEEALSVNDLSPFWPKKLSLDGVTEEELRLKKSRILL